MIEDFFAYALLGGLGVAVIAGPFGAVVVWRRMAFFGAAIAHSALLGVAIGLFVGTAPSVGMVGVCVAAALLVFVLGRRSGLAEDTLLGIVAHSALALGLVALALMPGVRVDLMGYLFGDILAVGAVDLAWIHGGGALALGLLALLWRRLIAIAVDEDLARVEGVAVDRVELAFLVLIALVVVAAMQVVGLLLAISMLVIPAAAARPFARTPERMAGLASAIGCVAVLGGLGASAALDLPAGPAVVVAAALLFAFSMAASAWR